MMRRIDWCFVRLMSWGSVVWSLLVRLAAAMGHSRARARVAIRWHGWDAVMAHRGEPLMWFHCASLGELEQAIPVMEAHRQANPASPFLLTLYSPSGYHPVKNRPPAVLGEQDCVAVLPDDHPSTWDALLDAVPIRSLALAKYDFWPSLMRALALKGIPIHVFAAAPASLGAFRASLWRMATSISAQDEEAVKVLAGAGLKSVADGDPRIDRVLARQVRPQEALATWAGSAQQVVVAGSTWHEEEQALMAMTWSEDVKLILVPHDVSPNNIDRLRIAWGDRGMCWTEWSAATPDLQSQMHVVIVDVVGMLFDLYRLGHVAVVGGAHGNGLHNVLEPASAGLPVVTGPNLGNFREAHALRDLGALRCANLQADLRDWLDHPEQAVRDGQAGLAWLERQKGASNRIVALW